MPPESLKSCGGEEGADADWGILEGRAETRAGSPGSCVFKEQKPLPWTELPGVSAVHGVQRMDGEGAIRGCPPWAPWFSAN